MPSEQQALCLPAPRCGLTPDAINATELFASEWTAVTIGELHLTASNLNKSIWCHSQIQTLHSDFKAKPGMPSLHKTQYFKFSD
jgi:hypothetical protein